MSSKYVTNLLCVWFDREFFDKKEKINKDLPDNWRFDPETGYSNWNIIRQEDCELGDLYKEDCSKDYYLKYMDGEFCIFSKVFHDKFKNSFVVDNLKEIELMRDKMKVDIESLGITGNPEIYQGQYYWGDYDY